MTARLGSHRNSRWREADSNHRFLVRGAGFFCGRRIAGDRRGRPIKVVSLRGTDGSNPSPSTREPEDFESLAMDLILKRGSAFVPRSRLLSRTARVAGAWADRGVSPDRDDCRVHSLPHNIGRIGIEHEQRSPQLSLGMTVRRHHAPRQHP